MCLTWFQVRWQGKTTNQNDSLFQNANTTISLHSNNVMSAHGAGINLQHKIKILIKERDFGDRKREK